MPRIYDGILRESCISVSAKRGKGESNMPEMNSETYHHELDRITDGFDIFFWVFDDKSGFVPTHWHSAIEISYVMEGSIDISLPNQAITLRPGDVNLLDSTTLHSISSIHGNKAILIQLPYPLLRRYIPDFDNLLFSFDCHASDPQSCRKRVALIQTIEQMQRVFEENADGCVLKFNSLVFELLHQLYCSFAHPKETSLQMLEGKSLERIKTVIKYTNEHYNEAITLSEIASLAAYQEEYFCHLFKKKMGITYSQYLNDLRMSYIYQDLISTDLPLKEILHKHGFSNYKVFRRLFYEKHHCTPGEYRKVHSQVQ